MSIRGSLRTTTLDPTMRLKARRNRSRRLLASISATALTVGLLPIVTASSASAAPDPCIVTITPSVTDDSATLGQTLDDSLADVDGTCANGATFFLGTTGDDSVYQLPKSLEWTSDDTLAIIGIGDDTPILSAADDTRVLTVADGGGLGPATVDLTQLSIRGGRVALESGGGVFLEDATVLTLHQVEFLNNQANLDPTGNPWGDGGGGAASAEFGTIKSISSRFELNTSTLAAGALDAKFLDIQGSEFLSNSALVGGAMMNRFGGDINVGPDAQGRPSRFIGNSSGDGGGIYVWGGSSSSIEAYFERNFAGSGGGGAIVSWDSTELEITQSTFRDDSTTSVDYGGGAIATNNDLRITDSTFIGASAPKGGAVAVDELTQPQATATITNSTFWGNSADDSGSAVYVDEAVGLSIVGSTFDDSTTNSTSLIAVDGVATASLAGSILSKDDSLVSPCEGSIDDSGGNLVTATCGAITGTSVVSDDSLGLLPPALNQTYPNNTGATPTIGLEPSSIAINHYTALCPSADQRGVPRPQGGSCDAGAYEAGGIESITPLATTSATVGTPFSQSLSATGFGSGTFVWDDSGTTLPPGLTLSSTGVVSGTPTTPGTYTFTARVTGPVDDSTTAQSITVSEINPPGPAPATPASPPQDVRAIPAIESATVSWLPPASTGTFPVTSYQAVATPGGQTCMVSAPALTCTITGLTPGKSYTVTARALTGAGWSAASSPGATVVPLAAPEAPSILITSSRDRTQKWMARIEGTTTGLVGAEVVPYIRVAGKTSFSPGASTRTVDADGKFTWQRKAKKRLTVYFTSGDVTSNRLIIRPE